MKWYIPVVSVLAATGVILVILISQGYFSSDNPKTEVSPKSGADYSSNNQYPITISNLSDGINYLGLQITKDLHSVPRDSGELFNQTQNVAFSPLNIAEALCLLLLGSSGKTFDEIAAVMKLNDPTFNLKHNSQSAHQQFGKLLQSLENFTEKSLELTTANGIFIQDGYPIGNKYKEIAMNIYKSEVKPLDFANNPLQAQNIINNWVSDKTNGKIKDILVEPPPAITKVILSTALYFKAAWEHPFSDSMTHKRAFYPNGRENKNQSIMVDMMLTYGDFLYNYSKEFDCEIFSLPYKGDTVSMYIIVPKKSNIEKLSSLEKRLTESNIQQLINDLKLTKSAIIMPKMKIESTTSLPTILEHIGVHALFDASDADLGILSPGESDKNTNTLSIDEIRNNLKVTNSQFFVEEIVHKVYIDINESGTEAAATTDVIIPRSGGIRMLVLDHPFLFFIRHNQTNVNLFYGFVEAPTPYSAA